MKKPMPRPRLVETPPEPAPAEAASPRPLSVGDVVVLKSGGGRLMTILEVYERHGVAVAEVGWGVFADRPVDTMPLPLAALRHAEGDAP